MNELSKPVRADLVDEIEALATRMNASAEEIEAAAREYAEHERWIMAETQVALDELEAGASTYDAKEVFDELDTQLEERIRAAQEHSAR